MIALLLAAAIAAPSAGELARRAVAATNEMRLDDAEREATRAMAVALECDDLAGRALAADALGIVSRLRGDTETALGFAHEAVAVAGMSGDADAIARAHTDLGRIHQDLLNRYDLAREEYERTLTFESRVKDKSIIARALINLGNLERPRAALGYFQRARRVAAAAKDRYGILASEHNIALVYLAQHDPVKALPHLRRALAIDSAYASRTLLSMSEAYRELRDDAQAATYLGRARRAATRAGDQLTLAYILLREADLKMERGEHAAAERDLAKSRRISDAAAMPLVDSYRAKLAFRRRRFSTAAATASAAAASARKLSQLDVAAQASALAAAALRETGDAAGAKRMLAAAIDATERRRRTLPGDDFARSRFFERELFPYEQMVSIAAAEGDAAAALQYAEMQKARLLADALGAPRTALQAARALRSPGPDETFVEYAMAGDEVIAIVVTAGGRRVVRLPVRRGDAIALAAQFSRMLSMRNESFRETARRLHDVLWQPLGIATQRVCVVPHEDLWRVAFPALIDGKGRFLVGFLTISYAASLTLPRQRLPVSTQSILAAANLPGETTEIEALRGIYGERVTVVRGATEADVKRLAPRYAVVHFAAHGSYVQDDPLDSHLTFHADSSSDGRLTARELMTMSLSARLVVISACSSAAGSIAPGEGVIGMSWALLVAGSPTVVAAQWEVESTVTTGIMRTFHRELANGTGPAAALRSAQLALLAQVRGGHPFYWAAFVVIDAAP
ncbi:MAG TPA: CHAT domain-containing tetratricopeptide repeat protein [Thermoanaerobaculia bacterium]